MAFKRGDLRRRRTSDCGGARAEAGRSSRAFQPRADRRDSAETGRGPKPSTAEELKLHPREFKAAFNLSRLYERLGNREGRDRRAPRIDRGQRRICRRLSVSRTRVPRRRRSRRGRGDGAKGTRPRSAVRPRRRWGTTCWRTCSANAADSRRRNVSLRPAARPNLARAHKEKTAESAKTAEQRSLGSRRLRGLACLTRPTCLRPTRPTRPS